MMTERRKKAQDAIFAGYHILTPGMEHECYQELVSMYSNALGFELVSLDGYCGSRYVMGEFYGRLRDPSLGLSFPCRRREWEAPFSEKIRPVRPEEWDVEAGTDNGTGSPHPPLLLARTKRNMEKFASLTLAAFPHALLSEGGPCGFQYRADIPYTDLEDMLADMLGL